MVVLFNSVTTKFWEGRGGEGVKQMENSRWDYISVYKPEGSSVFIS